jgi:hypothetical protein
MHFGHLLKRDSVTRFFANLSTLLFVFEQFVLQGTIVIILKKSFKKKLENFLPITYVYLCNATSLWCCPHVFITRPPIRTCSSVLSILFWMFFMLSTSELRFSSTASLLSAVQVIPLYDCFNRGIFLLCSVFNTASSAVPSDSTVSEEAGIDPRTAATSTLVVRQS